MPERVLRGGDCGFRAGLPGGADPADRHQRAQPDQGLRPPIRRRGRRRAANPVGQFGQPRLQHRIAGDTGAGGCGERGGSGDQVRPVMRKRCKSIVLSGKGLRRLERLPQLHQCQQQRHIGPTGAVLRLRLVFDCGEPGGEIGGSLVETGQIPLHRLRVRGGACRLRVGGADPLAQMLQHRLHCGGSSRGVPGIAGGLEPVDPLRQRCFGRFDRRDIAAWRHWAPFDRADPGGERGIIRRLGYSCPAPWQQRRHRRRPERR